MADQKKSRSKPKPGGRPRRTDWQEGFLDSFALLGIQSEAARRSNVSLDTIGRERQRDPEFAHRFDEAMAQANGVLLRFLHERATTGQKFRRTETTTKTKANGEIETTVSEIETSIISTPALLALCKARMPESFGDQVRVAHTGAAGGPVQVEIYRQPTPERARELLEMTAELHQAAVQAHDSAVAAES